MKFYYYDVNEFDYKKKLESFLDVSDLSDLNNDKESCYSNYFKTNEFLTMYVEFIKKYIKCLYNGSIAYQTFPVPRFVYKNKLNMYECHKDKWYRENTIYSDLQIYNIFLPFTNAFDTNTIWTESVEDKRDFAPINCNYGQFVHWDGCNLLHGNKFNNTNKTRLSIDFRVYKYKNLLHPEYSLLNS